MEFIREFIREVGNIIGRKILANPLSFLGVTSFFIIILYIAYPGEGVSFTTEDILVWGIVYIIVLSAFMNKKVSEYEDTDDKAVDKIEIKQNNISFFSFFKNTKK